MAANRRFATHLGRLGTETAYAVSDEARTLAATGKKIYPFHIGDLNFATPEVFKKAMDEALKNGKTGYCPAAGIPELRKALAEDVGRRRGVEYSAENVSIQSGGKPVIGKFLSVTMEEGDEVLYPSPGYPIYESMIKFLGGVPVPYIFKETDNGFEMDLEHIQAKISSKTKVFIYNNYSNPMGVMSSDEEMKQIAELCVKHDLWVLSDEAYFDITFFEGDAKSIVSLPGMLNRTVILYTYSKSFAMTGWRLGAAIGPADVISNITKINTNDEACTTHFIQYAGLSAFTPEAHDFTRHLVDVLRERRNVLVEELNKVPGFVAHKPESTFYVFVNVTKTMEIMQTRSLEDFRKQLLRETGVSFCTREHFGEALPFENQYYVRFAYSGIDKEMITEGIRKLAEYIKSKQH